MVTQWLAMIAILTVVTTSKTTAALLACDRLYHRLGREVATSAENS